MTAEHYYPDLQGKKTWLFGNASVLRNSQGDIIGAIESVRDITDKKIAEIELKKAKEEAEAAERVKNTFLAIICGRRSIRFSVFRKSWQKIKAFHGNIRNMQP